MPYEVTIPPLPESVTEATIAEWHKQPGDTVRQGENLVDLETDKVVLEVPAPADGQLAEIRAEQGTVVTAGEVVGTVTEAAAAPSETDSAIKSETPAAESAPAEASAPAAAAPAATEPESESSPAAGQHRPVSPSARRLLAEYDLDPAQIPSAGKGGRLQRADVEAYLQHQAQPEGTASAQPAAAATEAAAAPGAAESAAPGAARTPRRVPLTPLRSRVAERLVEVTQQTAMLTTFNEVDMSAVQQLRQAHRERFEARHGVRLGMMAFFTKAVTAALKRFPILNAALDDEAILYHDYYDIGIAVSSSRGLVVPVLRDTDRLSMAAIEQQISDFADRAETGQLSIDELADGTFTITNGGVFGSLLSTPIINPPQCGILGMHRIQERPVAVNGEVVIRPMMYLALSYDHRLVDGRDAVQFLVTVKAALEEPARLLLDV